MSKLRLLYVSEYFHPFQIGGAELSTAEHAAGLAEDGHDVTVLTPNYGAADKEIHRGIRVIRMPFPIHLGVGQAAPTLLFQNPIYYAYLGWWCRRLARRFRIDLIHAQNSFSVVGAYLGARLAGCPFAVTLRDAMNLCSAGGICLHERELPPERCSIGRYRACFRDFQRMYSPGRSGLGQLKARARNWVEIVDVKLRQWAIGRADLNLSVSDAMGAIYKAAGLVRKGITTVYNPPKDESRGSDGSGVRARYGIPPGGLMVLYVGKFSFGKGTDVLLEAVPHVRRLVPQVRFVLAGRTSPLVSVPSDDGIVATGPLPHDEVVDLYSEADVVVVPSIWKEPFPRVILEAMAAGRPVVATRSGGIPELVEDGVTGILVPPRDELELSQALVRLLEDPNLRKRMGDAGQERLDRFFTRERIRDDLVKAYRACLDGSVGGRSR